MNIFAIVFGSLVVLNIAAFLYFYKRTRRILFRSRDFTREEVEKMFRRIENRLTWQAEEFHYRDGPIEAWAVMFTRDRLPLAMRTLQTLREHEPELPVLVIDNGSSDGTAEALAALHTTGRIQKLLLNNHADVPQWQKSFAVAQSLKLLALQRPKWIVWLDDDLEITRPFLKNGITLLERLEVGHIKVVTLMDDEDQTRNHPALRYEPVELTSGAETIKIRTSFNGAFNLFPASFFQELGYPPIAEGIDELGSEDWFYSRQMQSRGYLAAVLPSATHVGKRSKRVEMSN